jgi:hypothetical protein
MNAEYYHHSPEGEQTSPYALKDLYAVREEFRSITDAIDTTDTSPAEIRALKQRATEQMVEKLLAHKERFHYVLETDHGSLYFILPTGESWRFKMVHGARTAQPIMRHVYFIDEAIAGNMLDLKKRGRIQEWLMSAAIPAELSPKVGLRPFELVIEHYPDYPISMQEHGIVISPSEDDKKLYKNLAPQFSSGYHIGNKISNIR